MNKHSFLRTFSRSYLNLFAFGVAGVLGICGLFSSPAITGILTQVSPATSIPATALIIHYATATAVSLATRPAPTVTALSANPVLPGCIHNARPQRGKVIKVVDGDTIHVLIDGQDYPVRYIGMDTPENTTQHEFYGAEASAKNSMLVAGQEVSLYKDTSETDRYGRLLRYVFVRESFINYELVVQGYAEAKKYPPDTACSALFNQAQANAKARGLGQWAANISVPTRSSISTSLKITAVDKIAEYVTIQNPTSATVNLDGWRLVSEKGGQTCSLGGTLQPGASLKIWTKSGSGFSCNLTENIWNNQETDPAVLYNPQGQEVARY